MNNTKGFSYLELTAVLAIAAIVVAIICILTAIPSTRSATVATTKAATPAAKVSTPEACCTPAKEDLVRALRTEAKARHLHLVIECNTDDDGYHGWAWHEGAPPPWEVAYIEEGGKPHWFAEGNSQEAVVVQLTELIKGDETFFPEHEPKIPKEKRTRICLRAIKQ